MAFDIQKCFKGGWPLQLLNLSVSFTYKTFLGWKSFESEDLGDTEMGNFQKCSWLMILQDRVDLRMSR